MSVAKKLVQAAAVVALGAGMTTASVATSARPASAAGVCSGSLVEADSIKTSSGTVLGWLNVYWDGTYNCAEVQSAGSTWGVKKYMSVAIDSCPLSDKGTDICHTISHGRDNGNYSYYAGPAKVYAVGRCISASGEIDLNGYIYQNWTHPMVGHC
jgi:hypothetical protein